MLVQSITIASAGATPLNTSTQHIRTPVTAGGRTTFRSLFGIRIRTGGVADAIRFNPAGSSMPVTFSPRVFDARNGSGEPQATVSSGGQPIKITLPAPVQIKRLRFTGVGTGVGLELFRMDGDEIASESTKQPGNNQDVSGDFTDARFAVTIPGQGGVQSSSLADVDVRAFPTSARVGIAALPQSGQPITPSFFHVIPGVVGKDPASPPGTANLGPLLAETLQQHIDSVELPYAENLDLLLVVESDAPCQFQASSFTIDYGLLRNSFRSVLLRSADFTDAGAFATRLREASTPLTAFLRAELSTGTRNAIDRAARSLADNVVNRLVSELNQSLQSQPFYTAQRFAGVTLKPETLTAATASPSGIARTRVNRLLLEEAFPAEIAPIPAPGGEEKEVLRAQGATASLNLEVDLPRAIHVRTAKLALEGDLRPDTPAGAAASNGSGNTPDPADAWAAPIADATGFSIDSTRCVACKLSPASAIDISGVSAALTITTPSAEIVAEIREDQSGAPGGRIVATATVKVQQLDRPSWVLFSLAPRNAILSLDVGYWLVLRVTSGTALWLAQQTAGTVRVGDPASKLWVDRGSFSNFAPLHRIWSASKTPVTSDTPSNGGGSNADTAGRLRVNIGSAVLTPVAGEGKVKVVNITSALHAFLTSQTSSGALVAAPVLVSALGKGNVTIYPPEVEYDLVP
jgi:hypothetical protein